VELKHLECLAACNACRLSIGAIILTIATTGSNVESKRQDEGMSDVRNRFPRFEFKVPSASAA
jgi:hypothetical protein